MRDISGNSHLGLVVLLHMSCKRDPFGTMHSALPVSFREVYVSP